MAEFAASIIGIVSAGTKVALVLSQLSADVGSAGHEARMIGGEIRSFCSVLKTLGETIEQLEKSPRYAHCTELIKDMTDDSLQMFTEILNAVDKLKKMTMGREGKDGNFGLVERVQWAVFKKPKLLVLRAAIEAYKTNLTLMLSTLSTAERASRRSSTPHDTVSIAQDRQDQSLLKSLELDREATLIELAQADSDYKKVASTTGALDTAPTTSPPAYETVSLYCEPEVFGLVSSARDEINSMRSSLSRTASTDHEALPAKMIRHSRHISSMLEDDKESLSQRWSLTLQKEPDTVSIELPLKPLELASHDGNSVQGIDFAQKSVRSHSQEATASIERDEEGEEAPAFDPRVVLQYTSFLSWIIQLDAASRQSTLRVLKHDIRQSYNDRPKLSSFDITADTVLSSSPVSSMKSPPVSPRLNESLSTSSSVRQIQISRSTSRKARKVSPLLALQYAQSTNTSANFLSDQSQRPPGRKPSPSGAMSPIGDAGRLLCTHRPESLSIASINGNLPAVSTPRQEALARLTGVGQEAHPRPSSASLPTLPSAGHDACSVPKIQVSRHRRSRSEHTLTVSKLEVPLMSYDASRGHSMHNLHQKGPNVLGDVYDAPSDSSDNDSDDGEVSSMWWRSLNNISPQPYRWAGRRLSRQESKRRLAPPGTSGSPHALPREPLTDPSNEHSPLAGTSTKHSAQAAHVHNRSISIVHGVPQLRATHAAVR